MQASILSTYNNIWGEYQMITYYVNKNNQGNGDHEVHRRDCEKLPLPHNRTELGIFNNCHDAVKEAKKIYPTADGCFYCSNECHTR